MAAFSVGLLRLLDLIELGSDLDQSHPQQEIGLVEPMLATSGLDSAILGLILAEG